MHGEAHHADHNANEDKEGASRLSAAEGGYHRVTTDA